MLSPPLRRAPAPRESRPLCAGGSVRGCHGELAGLPRPGSVPGPPPQEGWQELVPLARKEKLRWEAPSAPWRGERSGPLV